jgi:hypothetical protein
MGAQPIQVGQDRDVALHGIGAGLARGRVQIFLPAAGDDDLGAFLREETGRCPSHSGAAARHEGDLAG